MSTYDETLFVASRQLGLGFDEVDWYADHLRIGSEECEHFLNNEVENPRFNYKPQVPKVRYREDMDEIRQLLKEATVPEVVADLYEHKLKKLELRTALIDASLSADNERFYATSVELYGKPRKRFFSYVAKRVLELCDRTSDSHPTASRRLRKALSRVNVEQSDIAPDMLPPLITSSRPIASASEVATIFQEALERYEICDWVVEIDHSGTRRHFTTNLRLKTAFIPSDQYLLSRPVRPTELHMQALAEHEIGVHVRRASEGAKSLLRLLEVGLDGYLKGEEGVASYVQQQIEGADEFYGFDRYLAAGLAVGMDGDERDFRAVFSLMLDYYTLRYEDDDTGDHPAPFRAAWDVCVRLFRGTTGEKAGAIYTKDIVYFEGNIGIWELLSEKPHVFPYLFVGKYNPLLKRHVHTLQTLEIMPEW